MADFTQFSLTSSSQGSSTREAKIEDVQKNGILHAMMILDSEDEKSSHIVPAQIASILQQSSSPETYEINGTLYPEKNLGSFTRGEIDDFTMTPGQTFNVSLFGMFVPERDVIGMCELFL